MIDASVGTANAVYNVAYGALILGGVLTVVGLIALFWAEGIRSKYHSIEIATAQAASEEAKARAADANMKAAQANLELEKFKAPRTLTEEQRHRIIEKTRVFHGTTFASISGSKQLEPYGFSTIIAETLHSAGWVPQQVDTYQYLFALIPGVVVFVNNRGGHEAEKAGIALVEALTSEGISAKIGHDDLVTMIRIEVGPKP